MFLLSPIACLLLQILSRATKIPRWLNVLRGEINVARDMSPSSARPQVQRTRDVIPVRFALPGFS